MLSAGYRISFKIFISPHIFPRLRCLVFAVHQLLQPRGRLQKITKTATLRYKQQRSTSHKSRNVHLLWIYTYYIDTILIIIVASKANEYASGSKVYKKNVTTMAKELMVSPDGPASSRCPCCRTVGSVALSSIEEQQRVTILTGVGCRTVGSVALSSIQEQESHDSERSGDSFQRLLGHDTVL
jgi:hypothetical protein